MVCKILLLLQQQQKKEQRMYLWSALMEQRSVFEYNNPKSMCQSKQRYLTYILYVPMKKHIYGGTRAIKFSFNRILIEINRKSICFYFCPLAQFFLSINSSGLNLHKYLPEFHTLFTYEHTSYMQVMSLISIIMIKLWIFIAILV